MNRGSQWIQLYTPVQQINPTQRAIDTERMIAEQPTRIVVTRNTPAGEVTLAPQTVRLEVIQNIREANEMKNRVLTISRQYVVVIGYKDHPTIPDTDLQRADLFFHHGFMWEIVELIKEKSGRLIASGDVAP